MKTERIVIIGGGIVGLAAAYKLLVARRNASITVLEKESTVGRHQSGNNSGVLHAGLYYQPGSCKARLAVSGIRQMTAFCRDHAIPHEICGKLVVATSDAEIPRLRELMERGHRNGLNRLEWLEPCEFRKIEPHVSGLAALRVPEEGIVDFPRVCAVLAGKIAELGGTVTTGAKVCSLELRSAGWTIRTSAGSFEADRFINCAGLHSDRLAALAGEKADLRIVPFRGEYYKLRPDREPLVRHLVYPVPDPAFPFLGVHFTRLIGGGIEAGPNAVLALAREGYRWYNLCVRDLWDTLSFKGFWRFVARHRAACRAEVWQSLSRARFCRALQRLVPEIRPRDLDPGGAGVRAQAMLPSGDLVDDFAFVSRSRALHVLNSPSPAATAALAIGDEIVGKMAFSA